MAASTGEPPALTGKNIRGFCIVLDLVTTERNKSSWSSLNEEIDQVCKLFSGFNYDVKLIRDKKETEIRSELKTIKDNINDNHGSLVFIVFDNQWEKSGIGDNVKWRPSSNAPDLYGEFDEVRCKPLRNKPKIFLRHSFRQATYDVSATAVTSEPLQNTFSAASVIAGPKSEIQQQKSILVQTLVKIGSSCEHGICLVELFSKVCTQVEEQCSKLHTKTEGVFQNISFYKDIKSFKEVKRNNDRDETKEHRAVKEEITPSTAERSSTSTTVTTDVTDKVTCIQGFCVLLDLVTTKDNKDTWKTLTSHIDEVRLLFQQLNYDVLYIHDKRNSGIRKDLENLAARITKEHTSIVVIWLGKEEEGKYSNYQPFEFYWKMFNEDNCEQLRNKPKILIQHTFDLGKYEDIKEDDAPIEDKSLANTFHVTSTMKGPISKVQQQKSYFLESLVGICRRYAHEDELVELITKVCNNVEIQQYRDLPGIKPDKNTVVQRTIFDTKLKYECKLKKDSAMCQPLTNTFTEACLPPSPELRCKLQIEVMKTLQDDSRYKMSLKPRGYCIIINSSNNRAGSRIDEMKMKVLFEELYFEVKVIRNKRHAIIEKQLHALAQSIPYNHQALVVFIMAHGGTDGKSHLFKDIEDKAKPSSYIFEMFDGKHCSALMGRPKIFIVQTCFGGDTMKGIKANISDKSTDTMTTGSGETRTDNILSDEMETSTLETRVVAHEKSDVLEFNATLPGHKSFRNTDGSFVIKAIDDIFRQYCADNGVQDLLTRVSGRVAGDPITREATNESWQQPAIKDNVLNKHFYFNPGFSEDNLTDCYHPEAKLMYDDNYHSVWFDTCGQCGLCVNKNNSNLIEFKLDTETATSYYCRDSTYRGHIVNGVALDKDKHLVLLNNDGILTLSVILTSTEGGHKTWNMEGPLDSPKVHPITICEVYRDAVGVLTSSQELQIYNRTDFLYKLSKREFHSVKLSGLPMTNASVKVVTDKVLVLDHAIKTVVEYDSHGNVLHTLPGGSFNKPCGLTIDQDNNAAVVCADGLHIYVNKSWSHITREELGLKPRAQIRQMCCNSKNTLYIYENILDTSSDTPQHEKAHHLSPPACGTTKSPILGNIDDPLVTFCNLQGNDKDIVRFAQATDENQFPKLSNSNRRLSNMFHLLPHGHRFRSPIHVIIKLQERPQDSKNVVVFYSDTALQDKPHWEIITENKTSTKRHVVSVEGMWCTVSMPTLCMTCVYEFYNSEISRLPQPESFKLFIKMLFEAEHAIEGSLQKWMVKVSVLFAHKQFTGSDKIYLDVVKEPTTGGHILRNVRVRVYDVNSNWTLNAPENEWVDLNIFHLQNAESTILFSYTSENTNALDTFSAKVRVHQENARNDCERILFDSRILKNMITRPAIVEGSREVVQHENSQFYSRESGGNHVAARAIEAEANVPATSSRLIDEIATAIDQHPTDDHSTVLKSLCVHLKFRTNITQVLQEAENSNIKPALLVLNKWKNETGGNMLMLQNVHNKYVR